MEGAMEEARQEKDGSTVWAYQTTAIPEDIRSVSRNAANPSKVHSDETSKTFDDQVRWEIHNLALILE